MLTTAYDTVTGRDSHKSANSAFKQQRFPAYRAVLTCEKLLPIFILIGILFISIGLGLWFVSDEISEKVIPYTDCISLEKPGEPCSGVIGDAPKQGHLQPECTCRISFNLEKDFKGKVLMYYSLTNFYQNHRRFARSRDDLQLFASNAAPRKDCLHFDKNKEGKSIWPCGSVANSMFQDEITLSQSSGPMVELLRTGIAWKSDKKSKFKNPSNWNTDTFKQAHVKPEGPRINSIVDAIFLTVFVFFQAWKKSPWELDPVNLQNNGVENEDFITWMRPAARPNFRKLYRVVSDKTPGFSKGMPKGNYTLDINYSFPVKSFRGTKSIIISTSSFLGAKKYFLGIAFMIVGSVDLVLGIVFLLVHVNYGKRSEIWTFRCKQSI